MPRYLHVWCAPAGLACAFLATPSYPQVNLDFEARDSTDSASSRLVGWAIQSDDVIFELDSTTRRSGERSLRIAPTAVSDRSRFTQVLDPREFRAERIRIGAYAKSDTGGVAAANLRVRVEDHTGLIYIARTREPIAVDGDGWSRLEIDVPLAPTATELSFGGEVFGPGRIWFDDFTFEPIDTMALAEPSSVASRYVRYALSVIEENAFVRSDLNWPTYYDAVMRQARGAVTIEESYLAVRYALGALGDGHSHFMAAQEMEELGQAPVGNARTGRPLVAPRGALLADSIGYIRLPGVAGGSHMDRVGFAEGLQAMIADLDSSVVCGWIVDLRDNSGGNLWPMIAGLGPLLGEGEVGASVGANGERRPFWYDAGKAGLGDYVQLRVRGEPYRVRSEDRPIAVLTDDETASAAEILAAAFAARSGTRSFGEATRGAMTATRTFPLSDGAAMILAVANTSDRNGHVYAGPIVPDQVVAADQRGALEEQPSVRAARTWLGASRAPLSGCLG